MFAFFDKAAWMTASDDTCLTASYRMSGFRVFVQLTVTVVLARDGGIIKAAELR